MSRLTVTERPKTEFLTFPLNVIISPLKAFKEIALNPDIKGILLVVGLFLLANVGSYYAYSVKVFLNINGIPTSFSSSNMFPSYIVSVLIQGILLFVANWSIYTGVLLLVMRVFGQKGSSWRLMFILVGYAFSIMIIQSLVSTLLVATLPEIYFNNLNTWPPSTQDEVAIVNKGIQENWDSTIGFQALIYVNYPYVNIIDVWLVILSVIIVNTFTKVTWGKATMISVTSFLLRFFLKTFLGL